MKVKDRMSRQPITTTPEATVDQALGLMRKHGIRHLPVLDGDRLVGLVTDTDLRTAWLASQLEELSVGDLMHRDPIVVAAEDTVYQAARLLYHHKLTGLPVEEQGRLVGIITLADMLGVFLDLMGLLSDSSRLDLALAPEPQALEQVHALIRDHGGQVMCVALVSAQPEHRVYSFRLEKTDLAPIIQALEQAGHQVLDY